MHILHPPSSPSGSCVSEDWQESQSLVYGHSPISSRPNTAETVEHSGLWPELGVDSVEATQDSTGDWTTSLGFDSGFSADQTSKRNKKRTRAAKGTSKAHLRQSKSMHTLGSKKTESPSFSPDQINEVSRLEALAQEGFARRRTTSAGSARLLHVRSSKVLREQQSFHTAPDASIDHASAPRSSESSYMPASVRLFKPVNGACTEFGTAAFS